MLTCDDFCSALVFLLDNIFINFNNCIYRQKIGIPMGTNCAPLIADLFLFCYERDFMLHLSPDSQLDVIEAFNNTSRYLDDILNMNNDFFDRMVHEIYPKELTLTKSSSETTHATFLDLDIHLLEGKCVTKIYDKRDDFDFDIINFPHLDGGIGRAHV